MRPDDLDKALAEQERQRKAAVAAEERKIAEAEKTLQDITTSNNARENALKAWRSATHERDQLNLTTQ